MAVYFQRFSFSYLQKQQTTTRTKKNKEMHSTTPSLIVIPKGRNQANFAQTEGNIFDGSRQFNLWVSSNTIFIPSLAAHGVIPIIFFSHPFCLIHDLLSSFFLALAPILSLVLFQIAFSKWISQIARERVTGIQWLKRCIRPIFLALSEWTRDPFETLLFWAKSQ